jgi:hypothetical protein
MMEGHRHLNFTCPVCEATPGERCHVQIGVVRFESHLEREQLTSGELLYILGEKNALADSNKTHSQREWQVC